MKIHSSQKGFTIFSVLILSFIICTLTTIRFLHEHSWKEIQALSALAFKTREQTLDAAIEKVPQLVKISNEAFSCVKEQSNKIKSGIIREACIFNPSLTYNEEGIPNVWFNITKLFKDIDECEITPHLSGDRSSFGTYLGSNSIISQNSCREIQTIINKFVTYNNIETSNDLLIEKPIGEAALIATSGFADFNGSITSAYDLIVFAAGELRIKTLTIENKARVSLISTTSAISIENLIGEPYVYTHAWKGASINGSFNKQILPLLPTLKEIQFMGLVSTIVFPNKTFSR